MQSSFFCDLVYLKESQIGIVCWEVSTLKRQQAVDTRAIEELELTNHELRAEVARPFAHRVCLAHLA